MVAETDWQGNKMLYARYNIYLSSLIRGHIVTIMIIRVYFGPFHYVFVLHSTREMLLNFSVVINFNVKFEINSVTLAQVLIYYNCIKVKKPRICC